MADFAAGPVPALALSPSGTHVAAAAGQDHLALHALPPAPTLSYAALPLATSLHSAPSLTSISFPNPSTIYTADARGAFNCLSALDLSTLFTVEAAHGGDELTAVAALSSCTAVATAGKDSTVRMWDPETRQSTAKLTGHRYEVRDVALAAAGPDTAPVTLVASAGRDKTVRLWDVRASVINPVHIFKGHAGWVHSVALAAHPTPTLLSCAGDKTVRVWDLTMLKERAVFRGHEYRVWGVAVSPDGSFAVSGSTDATMRAWNLAEPGLGDSHIFEGHRDSVLAVDVARDGSFAVSGCEDGTLFVWDCATLFGRVAKPKEEVHAEVLVDLGDEHSRVSVEKKANPETPTAVPMQMDPVPIVVEKAVQPIIAGAGLEKKAFHPALQAAPVQPEPTHTADGLESIKAAVSVSVEQLPKYDKSAAELANALRRIKELEKGLEDATDKLAEQSTEMTSLRKTVVQKDAEIAILQKQIEASKNLINSANVRALLASNPRKADESLDYEEPVNKIGAVSDQLSALAARLDAMIAI